MTDDNSVLEPRPDTDEQRAVQHRRRDFKASPVGKMALAMVETVREYLKFRRAGVSRWDAVKGIETVLREQFPLSKFRPNCDECDDTGWRERWCRDASRCGRRWCLEHPEYEHTYVEACFCAVGAKRVKSAEPTPDDAVIAVGRRRKPKQRGFTQLGI